MKHSGKNYSRILNFLIKKSLENGKSFPEIEKYAHILERIYDNTSDVQEDTNSIALNENMINRNFDSPMQFFNSDVYTLMLVDQFFEQIKSITLHDDEIEIKNMLILEPIERVSFKHYKRHSGSHSLLKC